MDYAITISGVAVSLTNWATDLTDAANTEYCPIIFTINGATYGTNDTTATNKSASVAALETAVAGALTTAFASVTGEAGSDVATTLGTLANISWEWPFSPNGGANDAKDTALDNNAADDVDDAATISIGFNVAITQVD